MSVSTLSSQVTAVTVFRRGAMVTRSATIERGEDGFPSAVRLEGLPLLLDDGSLQVALTPEGEGEGPLARELRVTLAVPEPDADLRPPTNEELDAARLDVAKAQTREDDLRAEASRVAALAPGPRGAPEEGTPPIASPTEARLSLLTFRRECLEALTTRLLEASEATRVAKERLATLQERERKASRARNPRTFEARKAVVVGLSESGEHPADRLRLTLRYVVPGARWAPSYVLRLRPDLRGGTLELRALVGQATGERWSNVALTLSTANPQQWTELPELRSMRIGRRQPPPSRTGWRPAPTGADRLYADFDRDLPAPPQPPPPPMAAPAPRRPPPPSSQAMMTQSGIALGGMGAEELTRMREIAEDAPAVDALVRSPAKAKTRARAAPRSGGPPPPPMPQAAPMAPGAAAPAAPARFSAASAMLDLDDEVSGSFGYGGGGDGGALRGEPPASAVESLTADRSLLEYGSLRVPGPEQPHRGTLRRTTAADRYEQLSDLSAERIATALAQGEQTRSKALTLDHRAPPAGHTFAADVDGFDYAYPAQASVELDSDGELHGLPLSAPSVEATPRYIAVPRETQDVFRVVVLRNPLEAPLLPGPVDVYVDGRFGMASELEQTPPRGRVELGLGVEQAIKIARNVTFDDQSSGLLKRHRELEHRVEIELANHLEVPATVQVRERVPVPSEHEDDVEVSEHESDPAWNELSQDDPPLEGGREWTVEVGAGSKRTLRAKWSIRIPQSHEVIGGNRREG